MPNTTENLRKRNGPRSCTSEKKWHRKSDLCRTWRTDMTVSFKSLVTNCSHWYLGSSFGMFGKKCHICCFLQHPFYGQCWRWDIWLGGPLVWMGMAVLRCLAWTVVQGKCVQHATPHLFSLSRTTFLIVNLPHSEMPLLYFAGETCTGPVFLRHLSVLFFPSCFGFPGCIQWWILQVSLLTEPKSQSKTQQSSSITCLTHTGTHQSVMVPLKQISAFSKFDRNFTFVTKNKTPKPSQRSLPNMDSIPGLSCSSCHDVSWRHEWQLVPLTKGWWRLRITEHKDTKNIIQPGHKGGQCPLRVRRMVTCLYLWLRLWIYSTIISTY